MPATAGIFKRLDTILIRVTDFPRSKTWYEKVLGLSVSYVDDHERLVVFDSLRGYIPRRLRWNKGFGACPEVHTFDLGVGASVTLWQIQAGEQFTAARITGAYPTFLAEDAVMTRNLLLEFGVRVEDIVNTGGVLSFGFFDPDENRLEVCQV